VRVCVGVLFCTQYVENCNWSQDVLTQFVQLRKNPEVSVSNLPSPPSLVAPPFFYWVFCLLGFALVLTWVVHTSLCIREERSPSWGLFNI